MRADAKRLNGLIAIFDVPFSHLTLFRQLDPT